MKATADTLGWVMSYYDAIHANDFDTAMRYFTSDARCRFGNADFVVGIDAIREDLVAKHNTFRSLRHRFNNIWDVGDGVLVLDADAFFERHDGVTVHANGAGIFRYRGQQWTEQLHYADTSGVFTA